MGLRDEGKFWYSNIKNKFTSQRGYEILGAGTYTDNKRGLMTEWFVNPAFGLPRAVNTNTLREFAKSPYVKMCIDTIIEEVVGLEWDIVPKDAYKNSFDESKRDEIKQFFELPNRDEDFIHFMKKLLDDILSLDAGVIVKTFSKDSFGPKKEFQIPINGKKNKYYEFSKNIIKQPFEKSEVTDVIQPEDSGPKSKLFEMRAYDGATFLKQIDRYGRLPQDEPAYFQYSFMQPGEYPIPFFKREIVYFMMNPQTNSIYGWSPIQSSFNVLQALLNKDRFTSAFYEEFATPSGIITLEGMPDDDLKAIREGFKKEMKGKPWKTLFTNKKMDFKQLTVSNSEMEFLASHKFYMRVLFAIYHINARELGFTDDSAGKNPDENQGDINYRKAIRPLTALLKSKFDNEIIQEFYPDGECEVEFKFLHRDPADDDKKRKSELELVKSGITTINEYRVDILGRDPVEWGDEPLVRPFNPTDQQVNALGQPEQEQKPKEETEKTEEDKEVEEKPKQKEKSVSIEKEAGRWVTHEGRHIYIGADGKPATPPKKDSKKDKLPNFNIKKNTNGIDSEKLGKIYSSINDNIKHKLSVNNITFQKGQKIKLTYNIGGKPVDYTTTKNMNVVGTYISGKQPTVTFNEGNNVFIFNRNLKGTNREGQEKELMIGSFVHELHHNVYRDSSFSKDQKALWMGLSLKTRTDSGVVSRYAGTNAEEDFTETARVMLTNKNYRKEYVENPKEQWSKMEELYTKRLKENNMDELERKLMNSDKEIASKRVNDLNILGKKFDFIEKLYEKVPFIEGAYFKNMEIQ